MQLQLTDIVPIPLKEKILSNNSDVWKKNVSITQSEWIKIKASSGSGKTTLIHILYKLRSDFEGVVSYNSENINSLSANNLSKYRQEKISIIFQDLRLFQNLTARENIELKRVMQTPLYAEEVIKEMAAELGIQHILEQKAGLCSYGEQQRIAIIRALMQPFELLLMDEPFSHLDNINTAKAVTLISRECKKRNAAFLLTDLDDDDHFEYTKKLSL